MAPDRRKRTRVKFNFETIVTVDNREIKVQSHNLSLKGMLCSTDSIFQEDQVCRVTLNLHLKNIVESNAREPERIARELLNAAFSLPVKR
jgi:hypothetical protein